MRYAVTLKSKKISDATDKTYYFSDAGFTNAPTGTPANTPFSGRLSKPILSRLDMFDKLTTYGSVSSGTGEVELANPDGALDEMAIGYSFNGHEILAYVGNDDAKVFPTDWQLIQRCRGEAVTVNGNLLTVAIADKMKLLDKPLLQNKYIGNNVLPAGVEGIAQDLKDKRKPRVYGKVLNVSPYYVNTARLIFQVSDKPCSVTGVYDRGVTLTSGGSYAAFADLQNDGLQPSAGQYKVYSGAEGVYFRLGSVPAGTITCDAETAEKRCGELLKTTALDMGVAAGDISASDVATLNTIAYPCGLFAFDDITGLAAMNTIASALGAYFTFDRFGVLRMSRLSPPSGSPVYSVLAHRISALSLVRTADTDNGIPAWSVTVKYGRNYTTQNDLANTAAQARAAFAAEEWRTVKAENASVKTVYVDSPEVEIETSLINEADAQAEATRYLSLLSFRTVFEVTVQLQNPTDVAAVSIGDVISVTYPRYGLDSGRLFVVIGLVYNTSLNEITFRVWG